MLSHTVITRVVVGRRVPYTPLYAWLLADYIEDYAEERLNVSTLTLFPPALERLVGELYYRGDEEITETLWWELINKHTVRHGWCHLTYRVVATTYLRFWNKQLEMDYVLLQR